MSRFVIGDFLEVVGPSLQVDIAGRRVSGFARLRMTDGSTKLEFDTSPVASAITWSKNDATQIADGIALGNGKSANVDFHWPNPLTPHGAGITFHLVVKRTSTDHELDFFKTATPPRGMAEFEDEKGNRVTFFPARINHLLTLGDWRALDHTVSEASAKAIQSSPLFVGDASLIDDEPDHNKWTFGFGFAAGTDGVSRAIAAVDIDNESLAVNMRALRLEERVELRPRPLRWSRKLSLRCGGVRSDGVVSVWAVDWLGVPTFDETSEELDALTLRSFWQELARHWALGLRSIRSRNALTFFPTDINGGLDAWTFRYRCEKSASTLQTQLANIAPESPADCTFQLGAVLDTNGKACSFKGTVTPALEPLAQVTEKGLATLMNVKLGVSEKELGAFLIGGLMLDIGKLASGTLEIAWAPVRAQLGQPPLAVDLSLEAAAGTPRPGTEDPERGFESENDLLQRERPLVIDLRADPKEKTKLFVRENASGSHSRVLELLVRSAQDKLMAGAADVVIIDPAPMLVARVSAAGLEMPTDTILASYRDDGEGPPGWELHTESGAMTLVLPPQTIGEEMIKGLLSVNGKAVPLTDRPFDFRLSPPARLSLDRTDIDTARAAAPWALRRLLDRREAVVGLKLDAARFELLYGLTTRIEKVAGLRIAEQDAFVGRIPLTPDLRDRAQPGLSTESLFQDDERRYANDALKWIRGLFSRPAQLPVFRDFAARERLVIHEGATFSFRPTRQTVHPIRIAEKPLGFVEQPNADFQRLRLRGGVDFPFESDNIYVAANEHTPTMPGVPQGHVAGLAFGALGGSGSQQAGFDEGRSIIISETTHGRLNSLTLIRIGRIGMLWHHARHVIVYERTTRTAPRYEKEQPDAFEGLAALRKVKEYVEVTQPSRRYPDFPVAAEERPAAGPLTGCAFETQVIPVKSSWGHDIEEGWVIALRGPLEDSEKPFYPEPKIFFELARAAGKGSGAINHLASDPSQLCFFTTTREGLGADTDRWPAWPDVDFPLTRRPEAPKVNFLPGFSGSNHQPDAALHDYGQRRFTIDVFPPEEAANLLHGRPGNGLEARLRNVSLLRGGAANVRSSIDETVGAVFAGAEAQIADGLNELAQHLERLASRGADATVAELAGLRTETRALLASARQTTKGLLTAVDAAKGAIDAGTNTWKKLQARNFANAKSGTSLAQSKIGEKLRSDLKDVVAHLSAGKSAEEARVAVRAANETVCRQTALRIEGVPFLLVEVRDRLRAELQRSIGELQAEVDRAKRAWSAKLVELVARFPAEDARALEAELFDLVLDVRARLVAFSGTFGRVVKGRLGPLFGDIVGDGGAVGRLTAAVEILVDHITDALDDALDVIPPFAIFPPDAKVITELLDAVFPDLAPPFKAITDELLSTLETPFTDWQKALGDQGTELEKFCDKTAKDLLKAIDDGAAALEGLIDTVVDGWAAKVDDTLGKLETSATAVFKQFGIDHPDEAKLLEGGIDRAKFIQDEVAKAIDGLEVGLDDPTKTVRALADDAAAVARRAGAGLRRVGEQIEEAVANELRHVAKGAESAALELTRALAEGPITDTLRCTRDWVGYYYKTASDALDITRAAGVFNDLGGGVLNSLSAQVPFDKVRDRILAQLGDFDVNKLFPDFAGLKLDNLLSGMTIPTDPDGDYDWIKMSHGFDRARLTAWSEITIDKQFEDSPELFTLPPVTLSVVRPQFSAVSRIEADVNGVRAQRTRAQLVADWTVTLNGQMIMSIEKGGLYFDSDGGFRFDFGSNDLQLAPALQFVTDALRDLLPPSEGLTITPLLPGGVSVELSLPLPDIGTGAFTLTGITLFTHFDLLVAGGFEVRTGLWLSRPERPFGLAILFLGGGGWFGVDVRYKPTEEFETRVSVGLAAGAFIAVNFGVAHGSAGILFTVGLDFYRNWLQSGSQDLAITIGILVWGEFSILGIASAYLRVILRVEYRNGEMTGYGNVSVSIKICWCFTLRVDAPIRLPFAGGKKATSRALPATVGAPAPASASSRMAQILDAHFANLDV